MYVSDVCENGRFASYEEVCERTGYTANRLLEYNVVQTAVHLLLRNVDINDVNFSVCDIPTFCGKKVKSVKEIRKILVGKQYSPPCSEGFWRRKLGFEIDEKNWNLAATVTSEVRLRVLHWKILQNIYPTNILLCKMKVKADKNCTYCEDELDVLEHFFL
eukprot:GHVL01044226.1.p1 GENE.GHVL01044226.1~~GHVL01044226.1.p1  ORF type:complete len:160 (+),score=26.57 GHVL01044226.1:420-899(+)